MSTVRPTKTPPSDTPRLGEALDVLPLLKAYGAALELARRPPASLALGPRLRRLHCRLRPRAGCHYFASRYVLRRIEVLERAIARRTAVGHADGTGEQALAALRAFKDSLPPAPSRGWVVAAVIAAIIVSQGLLTLALGQLNEGTNAAARIKTAFNALSLSPDVRPVKDLAAALTAANADELGVVVLIIATVIYVFGRPFATGYRLGQMCVGRHADRSRWRHESPLIEQARRLAIPAHESAVADLVGADMSRDLRVDLVVKSAPWFAVIYAVVLFTRTGSPVSGLDARPLGALVIAAGLRLLWVVRQAPSRRRAGAWIGSTLVILAVVAAAAPLVRGVAVPGLHGDTRAKADERLRHVGLKLLRVLRRSDPDEQPGSVIEQSPDAGIFVHRGTGVIIVVSAGDGSQAEEPRPRQR